MIRIRVAVLLVLATLAQPAKAQLVTNGGFETGSLTGWSLTGGNCFTDVGIVAPHTGAFALRSGPTGGTCAVAQSFATTAGGQYTFSFWVANLTTGTPNSFDARWNGVSVYSTVDATVFGYTQQMFTVTASAPTTSIEFVIRHDLSFYRLDDVSVVAVDAVSTVPEPSTYALMAAGLLGIVAVRRRRRA